MNMEGKGKWSWGKEGFTACTTIVEEWRCNNNKLKVDFDESIYLTITNYSKSKALSLSRNYTRIVTWRCHCMIKMSGIRIEHLLTCATLSKRSVRSLLAVSEKLGCLPECHTHCFRKMMAYTSTTQIYPTPQPKPTLKERSRYKYNAGILWHWVTRELCSRTADVKERFILLIACSQDLLLQLTRSTIARHSFHGNRFSTSYWSLLKTMVHCLSRVEELCSSFVPVLVAWWGSFTSNVTASKWRGLNYWVSFGLRIGWIKTRALK